MKNSPVKGAVFFYCPSDQSKDRNLALSIGNDAIQAIDAHQLAPGHYAVKINWESNGQSYFNEQAFDIQ